MALPRNGHGFSLSFAAVRAAPGFPAPSGHRARELRFTGPAQSAVYQLESSFP